MKNRILGKTGLKVSELALGGLFVSKFGGDLQQSKNTVRRAVELGVNYIDTAPTYADSEVVLGPAMEGISEPLILSTKLGGRPTPFNPKDKDCLRKSVEMSLKALKRDTIDILFVHEPERTEVYDWWTDSERFTGPVTEVMEELKREGVIKYTGLAGTTAYKMARLIKNGNFDVVLTAFNYCLLWREAEHEVLPAAKEKKMGIVIGSPLQQGSLAKRWDDKVRNGAPWLNLPRRKQLIALYDFLDEINISLPELAIRWVISNPDISCVLMGAKSPQEVEMNVESIAKGPLPKDIRKKADEIAAMVPFRPAEENATINFNL